LLKLVPPRNILGVHVHSEDPMPAEPQPQVVTLLRDETNKSQPWQIVGANNQLIQAFIVQGDAVSWLLGQGYRWVEETQAPQQWRKA
jgi:hypothetical protein